MIKERPGTVGFPVETRTGCSHSRRVMDSVPQPAGERAVFKLICPECEDRVQELKDEPTVVYL